MNTWKLYGIQNKVLLFLVYQVTSKYSIYFVVTKFDIHEMGYHMVLNMAPKFKSAMNSMPEIDRL